MIFLTPIVRLYHIWYSTIRLYHIWYSLNSREIIIKYSRISGFEIDMVAFPILQLLYLHSLNMSIAPELPFHCLFQSGVGGLIIAIELMSIVVGSFVGIVCTCPRPQLWMSSKFLLNYVLCFFQQKS